MVDKKLAQEKKIRIVWEMEEGNAPVVYANHLQVSHLGGTEFHITFGHLIPPLTHGMDVSEMPDKIIIKKAATIVTTPALMKKFIEAMQENLNNYNDKGSHVIDEEENL